MEAEGAEEEGAIMDVEGGMVVGVEGAEGGEEVVAEEEEGEEDLVEGKLIEWGLDLSLICVR